MAFTLSFLKAFFTMCYLIGPLLGLLLLNIIVLGLAVGRVENWSKLDSLYYAFITATTVGYGDLRPIHPRSKLCAIAIALTGLLLTGIIVATGLRSIEISIDLNYNLEDIRKMFESRG